MMGPSGHDGHDIEAQVRRRTADLLHSNEQLREETQKLRQLNDELEQRLRAALLGSKEARETRRAALNLMEDAVAARHAAQVENSERRRIADELREADRRKDEFLAMLAHELRTPLSPLRNGLQVLRLSPLQERVQHTVEMMERQLTHIVRMVDDLMDVSRLTRGKIELQREPVRVAVVVDEVVEDLRPTIAAAGHELSVSVPAEALWLDADPTRLSQALANLLHNAAKYTERGGHLWLTATRAGDDVLLSVRDNGMGIAPELLPRVFDLFVQGERASGRSVGGLGLGLTLVRRLVEMHGGTISVASAGVGLGSEFIIRLPLRRANAAATAQPELPVHRARGPRRVLVVDDSHDAADSLAVLLEGLGFTIQVAYGGLDALAAIQRCPPDVVLLDIGMPDLNGYEVARRVRALPEGQKITLVALSGWGQESDRRKSAEAGINRHLVKPVGLEALTALLEAPEAAGAV